MDVVIWQASDTQLPSGKGVAMAFPVQNLGPDAVNGIRCLDVQNNRRARRAPQEELHAVALFGREELQGGEVALVELDRCVSVRLFVAGAVVAMDLTGYKGF